MTTDIRSAERSRCSKETDISLRLVLDGGARWTCRPALVCWITCCI